MGRGSQTIVNSPSQSRKGILQGRYLRMALERAIQGISLPLEQEDALGYYAGDEIHTLVNTYLRSPEGSPENELADHYVALLDAAFQQAPKLQQPVLLFRGIPKAEQIIFPDPAFMSTTIDLERAQHFAGEEGLLLEVEVEAGVPVLPVHLLAENLPYPSEEELLLPRDSILEALGDEHLQLTRLRLSL